MLLAMVRNFLLKTWDFLKKPFSRSPIKKLRPEDIEFIPMPNNLSPEERAEAYARVKADFDLEEIQRIISGEEKGIPMEDLLRELEEIQRQSEQGS